ncbi:DUF2341 domain-containing protein [Flammeovirgaceae bacterium SG7u.111]|nr:DUF2341 domain-containing protein [Flammeovirgaceae bacterium SG7u.132]WPO38407.1 DUF2341 domain-containing protein [Flammeovirgaceae bacterium SG7u.111]
MKNLYLLTLLLIFKLSAYCQLYEDYQYYKVITIDATDIPSDQTNFPLLIQYTNDLDLRYTGDGGRVTQVEGYDIVFALESDYGTQLDHDLEWYESSAGGADVTAWVRIPILSSTVNTVIYMYYGNSLQTTSSSNADDTWDGNYNGVWHLSQIPDNNGGTFEILDSSGNGLNGTANGGMGAGNVIDSKVGKGLDFDGNNNYVTIPDNASLEPATFTISCWFRRDDTQGGAYAKMFSKGREAAPHSSYTLELRDNVTMGGFQTGRTNGNYVLNPSANNTLTSNTEWYHFVGTFDDSNKEQKFYLNGNLINTKTTADNATPVDYYNYETDYPLAIGALSNGINPFRGGIDELHLQNSIRDADWISIEYANINDPSDFASTGPEQSTILLPVELLNFGAVIEGEAINIYWATAQEFNNDFFVVEKSLDGINFNTLETINSHDGNSLTVQKYKAYDEHPTTHQNYYRLKQVDYDGTTTYSKVVLINFGKSTSLHVFPITETNSFDVEISTNIPTAFQYIVTDLSGKKVASGQRSVPKGSSVWDFSLEGTKQGMYLLMVITSSGLSQSSKIYLSGK